MTFKTPNTILKMLQQETRTEKYNNKSIYGIKFNTCDKWYVGQTAFDLTTRHKEHIRYIKENQTQSAYATHILSNNHEYGRITGTIKLLNICNKSTTMNCWKVLLIQHYKSTNILIEEQQVPEQNSMFKLARLTTEQTEQGTE